MTEKKLISLLGRYIETEKVDWSPGTKYANESKIKTNIDLILKKPHVIYKTLLSRYEKSTTHTVSVLIIGFLDWLIERSYIDGPNSYRIWYKRNVKKRSAFLKPKIPNISFDEALSRISTIPELHVRKKAMQLLIGGLRYAESFRIDPETMYTVGKGDKPRRVYLPKELLEIPDFPISSGQHMGSGYHLLSERLKELKLKPHDLRKIRATHLARFLDATDLMKFFGWESIVTAQYYVGGRRIEEVKKVVDDLTPKLGFELLTRNEKRKHASRSKL